MREFGHSKDAFRRIGMNIVCLECGNHSEFDFYPDGKIGDRILAS